MFFASGPNSVIGTAGLLIMIEHQVQYAVMAAQKLQRERLKSIEPKPEAIADFDSIIDVRYSALLHYLFTDRLLPRLGLFQERKF